MTLNKTSAYLAAAILAACTAVSSAQSLADVARAEEARRKTVKVPSKTYTNGDLKGGTDASPEVASPSAASTPASGSAQTTKPTDPAANAGTQQDLKKEEKYWRDRLTAAKQTAARDAVLLDALQSRVNALNTDFVNTDDPAQRAVVDQNRRTALAEMDRVKKDIDAQNKEIAAIQEEARKANVPAGWLR